MPLAGRLIAGPRIACPPSRTNNRLSLRCCLASSPPHPSPPSPSRPCALPRIATIPVISSRNESIGYNIRTGATMLRLPRPMRLIAAVLATSLAARVDAASPPFVHGSIFYDNESGASIEDSKPVYGCCESTKLDAETCPEDLDEEHHRVLSKVQIGTMPQMTSEQ